MTTVTGPATGVYGGIGPYVGGYGLGFTGAPYGFGFGPGRYVHKHNSGTFFTKNEFTNTKFEICLTHLIRLTSKLPSLRQSCYRPVSLVGKSLTFEATLTTKISPKLL